jgi:hypothetical protein
MVIASDGDAEGFYIHLKVLGAAISHGSLNIKDVIQIDEAHGAMGVRAKHLFFRCLPIFKLMAAHAPAAFVELVSTATDEGLQPFAILRRFPDGNHSYWFTRLD